jgi:hypothetical protein
MKTTRPVAVGPLDRKVHEIRRMVTGVDTEKMYNIRKLKATEEVQLLQIEIE